MKKAVADAGQAGAKKRGELAKEGFEKALADMRELAEMATKSQKEAFDVVRRGSKRTWKASETLEKSQANDTVQNRKMTFQKCASEVQGNRCAS